ncbi:hypothetical protein F4805DRAFT_380702 [Annulohypoxylon moriforme]|nr:hypothetical protein F4805DRAFT_380702 [Annulohypoxylon moriforme]
MHTYLPMCIARQCKETTMLSSPARAARIHLLGLFLKHHDAALLDVAFPDHSHFLVRALTLGSRGKGRVVKRLKKNYYYCIATSLDDLRSRVYYGNLIQESAVLREGDRASNGPSIVSWPFEWVGGRQLSSLVHSRCIAIAFQCSSAAYYAWASRLHSFVISPSPPQLRIAFSRRYHLSPADFCVSQSVRFCGDGETYHRPICVFPAG